MRAQGASVALVACVATFASVAIGCVSAIGDGGIGGLDDDAGAVSGDDDGGAPFDGGDRPRDPGTHDSGTRDGGRAIDGGVSDTGVAPSGDDASPPPPPPPPVDAGGSTDGCYSEPYFPTVSIDALASSYGSSKWLDTSLAVTKLRYPTGHFILDYEKGDPQLPGFADSSSFDALMESLMTMCHEETHGWDYEHATGSTHEYVMRDDFKVDVPKLPTFPRSEVMALITDDSTSLYDDTYLKGSMGTYDFADMNDELNAYTNGLACITAVAERISSGISARDGAVAHLLYLQLYLKRARTAHASTYTALKADANWQKFVRFAWARVHFWDAKAAVFPNLTIGTDRIWTHVNDPANLDEIRQFTGDEPAIVACHP